MKTEDQDRFPGVHIFSVCFFSFFFNTLMLNCFICILEKWHHQNDQMVIPELFILKTHETYGVGVKFGPLERELDL